ncbi:hypothetical protein J2X76_003948 [Neorhizobium sp. 2083]|uniref:hypothetical protein n=1 Tax=Neorhizobium sp. 2083 TaxID=2817762 RepID=UPI00285FB3DE|nr:hypothetical protein [Neorhizobium sp. 2083]MDR6818766.1 hypothetical protein [Neorhizobium sp. 2083]
MTEGERAAMIEAAVGDLKAVGRHWLQDPDAKDVRNAVSELLPGYTITAHEPEPWDEWFIVDHSFQTMTGPELEKIAREQARLRKRNVVRLPSGADLHGYTAHSVLRDPHGELVDITPVEDRNFVRRRFIPHLGDDATFLRMRTLNLNILCQGNGPAPAFESEWVNRPIDSDDAL